jgi:hypothetical protein
MSESSDALLFDIEFEQIIVAEGECARIRRDALIRAAMAAGLPRAAIAQAAGLTEARLYQIRDGRR